MVQLFAIARLVRSALHFLDTCLIWLLVSDVTVNESDSNLNLPVARLDAVLVQLAGAHSFLAGQAARRALASVRLSGLLKRRDPLAVLQVVLDRLLDSGTGGHNLVLDCVQSRLLIFHFSLSDDLAGLVCGLFRLLHLAVEIRVKCFACDLTQLLFLILSTFFFEAI